MTTVQTTAGMVRGSTLPSGTHLYRGIPYGGPTGGANRFRPPTPPEPWTGERDATNFGASSPQNLVDQPELLAMFGGIPEPSMSEDCLVLNVWTPAPDGARRPVLVYFHGGGHSMGSGSWPAYDGEAIAGRDAVVVTVNHRLGILGYLALDHLLGPDYAAAGASGVLDLVAALEWVRDNIERFGGDPGNVTMFGESGGGSKVAALLAMPSAQGLFHRSVIMSGWFGMRCVPQPVAQDLTAQVLERLGLDASQAEALLKVPAEEFVRVETEMGLLGAGIGPVIDGQIIPGQPMDAVRSPLSAPVPMMIGSTRDEYSMFLGFAIMGHEGPREAGAEAYLTKTFGAGIEAVVKAYTADRPNSSIYDVYEAMATFGNVRRPTIEMVEAQLAAGGPVYVYRFDWSSPLDPSLKAAHGLDIPFFFDTVDTALATGTAPERAGLAQDMCGALVRFARSGNPNPDGGNDWPAYSLDRRASMLFGVPSTVADDPDQAERQAWALLG